MSHCPTPGCPGDVRYAAPGRNHMPGCRYPVPERADEDWATVVNRRSIPAAHALTDDALTDERLAALRATAEAATPGPWWRSGSSIETDHACSPGHDCWPVADTWPGIKPDGTKRDNAIVKADAAHIAAFDPPTALALLDEVARLRADNTQLREQVRTLNICIDSLRKPPDLTQPGITAAQVMSGVEELRRLRGIVAAVEALADVLLTIAAQAVRGAYADSEEALSGNLTATATAVKRVCDDIRAALDSETP